MRVAWVDRLRFALFLFRSFIIEVSVFCFLVFIEKFMHSTPYTPTYHYVFLLVSAQLASRVLLAMESFTPLH